MSNTPTSFFARMSKALATLIKGSVVLIFSRLFLVGIGSSLTIAAGISTLTTTKVAVDAPVPEQVAMISTVATPTAAELEALALAEMQIAAEKAALEAYMLSGSVDTGTVLTLASAPTEITPVYTPVRSRNVKTQVKDPLPVSPVIAVDDYTTVTFGIQKTVSLLANDTYPSTDPELITMTILDYAGLNTHITISGYDRVDIHGEIAPGEYAVQYSVCDSSLGDPICSTAYLYITSPKQTPPPTPPCTPMTAAEVKTMETTLAEQKKQAIREEIMYNTDGEIVSTPVDPRVILPTKKESVDTVKEVNTPSSNVAVVPCPIRSVVATNDKISTLAGTATSISIIKNDTIEKDGVSTSTVTVRITGYDTIQKYISLAKDGTLEVSADTPAGAYTIDYEICDIENSAVCSIAQVYITIDPVKVSPVDPCTGATDVATVTDMGTKNRNGTEYDYTQYTKTEISTPKTSTLSPCIREVKPVEKPTIVATNDKKTGIYGTKTTMNVLGNDMINNEPTSTKNVRVRMIDSGALGEKVRMDESGNLETDADTPAGTYVVTYEICDISSAKNCTTATATIYIPESTPIYVTPSTGGGGGSNPETPVYTTAVVYTPTMNAAPATPAYTVPARTPPVRQYKAPKVRISTLLQTGPSE